MRTFIAAFVGCYTLSLAFVRPLAAAEQVPLDLSAQANDPLDKPFHLEESEGNHLKELMNSDQELDKVKYHLGEKMLQLGSTLCLNRPKKIEGIPVDKSIAKLHILHATGFGTGQLNSANFVEDGTKIGHYTIHYADGASEELPIVYGEDVRDWWDVDDNKETKRGKVVWRGKNALSEQFGVEIRLYASTWENPHPDKPVKSIDFIADGETAAAPFCLAITAETP